jgi:probable rRNA maturation factor
VSISFYNEEIDLPELEFNQISRWLKSILRHYRKKLGNISYIFCNDSYLLDINVKFLNHDYLTDIITFDYVEGDTISGDIYISVDRVFDNSNIFNTAIIVEYKRVIVHGILHLLGNKDETPEEKEIMRKLEDQFLEKYTYFK